MPCGVLFDLDSAWIPGGLRIHIRAALVGDAEIPDPENLSGRQSERLFCSSALTMEFSILRAARHAQTAKSVQAQTVAPTLSMSNTLTWERNRRYLRLPQGINSDSSSLLLPSVTVIDFPSAVQPFPTVNAKWQISIGGGNQPRWRANGKELYFMSLEGKLMAAAITTSGSSLSAATPVELFAAFPALGSGANK